VICPGAESFVELIEGGDVRSFQLGEEGRADQLIQLLDFSVAHRAVRLREDDRVDAQRGHDLAHVPRAIRLAVVIVHSHADPEFLQAATEDQLQCRQVALEAEATVQQKTRMIVEESVQVRASHLARSFRVGQPRADEHVALPQCVRRLGLEAIEILAVRHPASKTGHARGLEHPVQRAALDHVRLDQLHVLHDRDQPVQAALRHLALELDRQLGLLRGQRLAATGWPGLVPQAVQSLLPIAPHPDADRLRRDPQRLAVRPGPNPARELLEQGLLLTPGRVHGQVRADHLVAHQSLVKLGFDIVHRDLLPLPGALRPSQRSGQPEISLARARCSRRRQALWDPGSVDPSNPAGNRVASSPRRSVREDQFCELSGVPHLPRASARSTVVGTLSSIAPPSRRASARQSWLVPDGSRQGRRER